MKVTIYIGGSHEDIDIEMVDVWYKENYWTTSSKRLGEIKTGPFKYNKGLRQATLWDGAGTAILEINDFEFPPYHYHDDGTAVSGRAFYNVKDRPLRYGEHRWYHWKEKEEKKD